VHFGVSVTRKTRVWARTKKMGEMCNHGRESEQNRISAFEGNDSTTDRREDLSKDRGRKDCCLFTKRDTVPKVAACKGEAFRTPFSVRHKGKDKADVGGRGYMFEGTSLVLYGGK